jgi:hypothetical protein
MWQTMILSFLAGIFGANGVPHFVKGITKETYRCVFGNSSVPNLVAGWAGFVVAVLLISRIDVEKYSVITFVSGAIGVLLIGLFHAWHGTFGRNSRNGN